MKLLPFLCLTGMLFVSGCYTVRTPLPDAQTVTQSAQKTLQQKKEQFKLKQKAPTLPQSLGGLVKSDEWIIYKDQEQEEFKGHVSYDNGVYTLRAGYVLSDRKNNTITATQNVYLKQHEPQSPVYEAYADRAVYHYKTGKGTLSASTKTPVKLILTQEPAQTVTATAKQIDFDTNTQIFTLTGNVFALRTTPEGTQTLKANKVIFKQLQDYLLLEGNALLSDGQRTLRADTILYNGAKNEAHAQGSRPLLTGSAEQGTFAIIADKVSSDAAGEVVVLDGNVQGWLVAPELNNNKLNSQF